MDKLTDKEMQARLDNVTNEYNVDLFYFDLIDKLKGHLGTYYKLCEDGIIRPLESTATIDAPWIYVRPKPELDCHMWHKILFDAIGQFPPGCEDCWKVVVRPRDFKELMMLFELQENYTERYCKCGHEERPYVFGQWGGYFYCTGKEEGLEVYKEVRAMVDKFISPDISVTLKRYCSEYEIKYGATNEYREARDSDKAKAEAKTWERIIYKFIDHPKNKNKQFDIVKANTVSRWMKKAYDLGDKTVLEFNMADEAGRANGGHLIKQLVTYHKENK